MAVDVIQGEKQSFTINLKQPSGSPFDLTGFTEITVCFKAGSTVVQKLESLAEVSVVGADTLGTITVDLAIADSDSFSPTGEGHIEVHVAFSASDVRKTQILNAFQVTAKLC